MKVRLVAVLVAGALAACGCSEELTRADLAAQMATNFARSAAERAQLRKDTAENRAVVKALIAQIDDLEKVSQTGVDVAQDTNRRLAEIRSTLERVENALNEMLPKSTPSF